MKSLDRLSVRRTGQMRLDDFAPLTLTCNTTGDRKLDTLDRNEEFSLQGKLEIRFWANRAQYDEAYKSACDLLAYKLYEPAHILIRQLKTAIYSGDKAKSLFLCDSLLDELK